MSPELYDETMKELDHYRQAFQREKEVGELVEKVEKSRRKIAEGEYYSEEDYDKLMDSLLG